MILYSVSKWRENNASATRRIDDDGKVLKKIPLSLVQVGAYILRTVDRVSYWPSDSKNFQVISDLLLSHFSSWFSFNITWIYINNKKILDFTGNFWENSKIAYKEFFFYECCIINIEKWINSKNDRCKYVRILQYLRK